MSLSEAAGLEGHERGAEGEDEARADVDNVFGDDEDERAAGARVCVSKVHSAAQRPSLKELWEEAQHGRLDAPELAGDRDGELGCPQKGLRASVDVTSLASREQASIG